MAPSKRSKFRLTLSSLQICRSKQTASMVTCPLPKSLVFSPFSHKSLEISYPNLPEPPPSTPTDLSGIWDAPSNAACEDFETSSSRFQRQENVNKEKLKDTDRCSSSQETDWWSSAEGDEETQSILSSPPASNSSMGKKSRKKLEHCCSPKEPGLEQLIEDAKVDESYAVLKRSKSPADDFKKSMMEMIVEKQMSGVDELEQLLSCFLSLNSRHHHPAIVSAFTEVWMALFSQPGWPSDSEC